MADRRRINGPSTGSSYPTFTSTLAESARTTRARKANEPRKTFLQTGFIPSASGSAYLELETSNSNASSFVNKESSLKLSCAVHGPTPLPMGTGFAPQLILKSRVRFAPFCGRRRRGFHRGAVERDLGAHLQAALRAVVLPDRWPKCGIEIYITVLESEDDGWCGGPKGQIGESETAGGWGAMNILAGCITAASAALVEAGVECIDLVSGGCSALVSSSESTTPELVVDPNFPEHRFISAACVTGYLQSTDELAHLWLKGDAGSAAEEQIVNQAVEAAKSSRTVLAASLRDSVQTKVATKAKTSIIQQHKVHVGY